MPAAVEPDRPLALRGGSLAYGDFGLAAEVGKNPDARARGSNPSLESWAYDAPEESRLRPMSYILISSADRRLLYCVMRVYNMHLPLI